MDLQRPRVNRAANLQRYTALDGTCAAGESEGVAYQGRRAGRRGL